MLKKTMIALLTALAVLAAPAAAFASVSEEETEPTAIDQEWNTDIYTEITDEMQELFNKATEKLMGVGYEPVAVLATEEDKEEEGTTVTCFLCRGTVVYPGAKPYYVLMYVREAADGEVSVQNIWELWIEPHSKKEE